MMFDLFMAPFCWGLSATCGAILVLLGVWWVTKDRMK